jgi:hypothetical protein
MTVTEELPEVLATAVADLELLDDEALWRAARTRLDGDQSAQMEALHVKRQSEGLSAVEEQTLEGLVVRYERSMLVAAVERRLTYYVFAKLPRSNTMIGIWRVVIFW